MTGAKGSHDAILAKFVAHDADILIGTQMIAKGLDLPLVTLVGVVAADIGLFLPDFRASERTFQLLTQVAGRAGRSALGGEVVVQTYHPDHYAIVAASNHDYEGFYREEMAFRRQQMYPPLRRLARLVFYHTASGRKRRPRRRRAADLLRAEIAAQLVVRRRPHRTRAVLLRPAAGRVALASGGPGGRSARPPGRRQLGPRLAHRRRPRRPAVGGYCKWDTCSRARLLRLPLMT